MNSLKSSSCYYTPFSKKLRFSKEDKNPTLIRAFVVRKLFGLLRLLSALSFQLSYLVDSFHLWIKLAQFQTHLTSETLQPRILPLWPSQFNCRDSKSASQIISFIFSSRSACLSDGLHKFKGRLPMENMIPLRFGLLLKSFFLL